jgi:CMP-N-acetylneuraminic acid synthetase
MKDVKDVCVIVQARTGSTRVPNKMLRDLGGTNLTELILQKLLLSESIPQDNIYLAAHEKELLNIADNLSVNTFQRSHNSANSESSLQEIFEWHSYMSHKYDYVVMVSGCLPFLKTSTIDSFYDTYIESDKSGLFGVIEKKQYYWKSNGELLHGWPNNQKLMDTKSCDTLYEAAHALYASPLSIIKDGYFMDNNIPPEPELFVLDESECFDIDYEWQFERAKQIIKYMISE